MSTLLLLILFRLNSSVDALNRIFDLLIMLSFIVVYFFGKGEVKARHAAYLFLVFTVMFASFYTGLIEGRSLVSRDLFEFFRPILYFFVFSVFYSNEPIPQSKLNKILILYLCIQASFIILQIIFPGLMKSSMVSILYSAEKVSGGLGRVTGLSGNPNTLAICLSLVYFYFVSLYVKKRNHIMISVIALLHLMMLVATTSRGVTLIVLMLYALVVLFYYPIIYKAIVVGLAFSISGFILYYLTSNPYFNQLIQHIISGDIQAIPSVYKRMEHFQLLIDIMQENYLFSMGANKSLANVGDNVYIFWFSQWGAVGLLFHLIFVIWLFSLHFIHRNIYSFTLLLGTVLLIIAGVVYDTFYNIIYMPILLFFAATSYQQFERTFNIPNTVSQK